MIKVLPYIDLRNAAKNSQEMFFLDNCPCIGCGKFSLLPIEYLSSAVKLLTDLRF